MINKYFDGQAPDASATPIGGFDLIGDARRAYDDAVACMTRFDLAGGVDAALRLVRQVDAFINATEPFKLAKAPGQEARVAEIEASGVLA